MTLLAISGGIPKQCLYSNRFLLRRYHRLFWQGLALTLLLLSITILPLFLLQYWEKIGRGLQGNMEETVYQSHQLLIAPLTFDCLRGLAFTGGFGLTPLLLWAVLGSRFRTPVVFCLTLLAAISIPNWWQETKIFKNDQPGIVAFTAEFAPYPLLSAHLHPGDVVYWNEHPLAIYYSFKTASYVNRISLIGIVFSEQRSKEVARRFHRVALAGADAELINQPMPPREKAIAALQQQKAPHFNANMLQTYQTTTLSRAGLSYLCTDPELDYVIHDAKFPELLLATEQDPTNAGREWHLYSCKQLRAIAQ